MKRKSHQKNRSEEFRSEELAHIVHIEAIEQETMMILSFMYPPSQSCNPPASRRPMQLFTDNHQDFREILFQIGCDMLVRSLYCRRPNTLLGKCATSQRQDSTTSLISKIACKKG